LGIYLDWDASACASRYRIFETDNPNYNYTDLGLTSTSQNYVDLTGAIPNIYLGYRIAAVDATGHEGETSCTTASSVPWSYATYTGDSCHAAIGWAASPAPSYAWATQRNYADTIKIGWNPVQLTWNYLGAGTNTYATLYYVDISYDNATWTPLYDMTATATSTTPLELTVNTLPANTNVYFRIVTAGYPEYPTVIMGQTAASAGTVTGSLPGPMVTASAYYPGVIMVGWSTITGATRYELQRAQDNGAGSPGTWVTIVSNTLAVTYNDTAVTPWTGYWYRVRAYSGATAGAWTSVPDFGSASSF